MSFYAYSPLAGGFLTKTKQDIADGKGRFNEGSMYKKLYSKPAYLECLAKWESIAKDEGISAAEMGYRWVTFNSPLKREKGDLLMCQASPLSDCHIKLKGQIAPAESTAPANLYRTATMSDWQQGKLVTAATVCCTQL